MTGPAIWTHLAPLALSCTLLGVGPAAAQDWLPDTQGRETFVMVCTSCHSFDMTRTRRRTSAEWGRLVRQMLGRDGRTDEAERDTILAYVTDNFGFDVNINRATAKQIESAVRLTQKDAEAIVNYRQVHGDFKEWSDLLKVEGVDADALEAVRNRIVITPPAPPRVP